MSNAILSNIISNVIIVQFNPSTAGNWPLPLYDSQMEGWEEHFDNGLYRECFDILDVDREALVLTTFLSL